MNEIYVWNNGGMIVREETEVLREKSVLVQLCRPHILHPLVYDQTQGSMLKDHCLPELWHGQNFNITWVITATLINLHLCIIHNIRLHVMIYNINIQALPLNNLKQNQFSIPQP
jgi:hypothetical protein